MTALTWVLAAYLVGVAVLLLADVFDEVHLTPLAHAVWTVAARRYRYTGRHWALGPSTMQLVDAARADREALGRACTEPTDAMILPDFDGDVGPYQPKAGVARYSHLSPEELEWRARHQERALELHVDLAALRTATVYEWELVT